MTSPIDHLGIIRTRGWRILGELVRGKDAPQDIAVEKSWARDLVAAARPFNEVWAIKLGTLSPIGGSEALFAQRYASKVSGKRHRVAVYCHAVRLRRLDKLLNEIKDGTVARPTRAAKPVRKTGRTPGHGAHDDAAAVAEIKRLVAKGLTPWSAASKAEPLAARGSSIEQNAKRIYGKYKRLYD